MKRKGFKILTAAVMLTLGLVTMSAYAAEGWAMSNNSWIYLDKYGNKVIDEWRKGADNLWRYLNYKGEMAISTWADDDYYVDSNGIMVSNQWVKTKSQFDDDADEEWYYFGSSGKVAKEGWKKIDGKSYLFDDEGIMQTGWVEDGMYYLGDDGVMKTGWKYLAEPTDEDEAWKREYAGPVNPEGKYWFYFGGNGKKYCPATGTDDNALYRIVKISGDYYCFDEHGRMMTGWVYVDGEQEDADSSSIRGWRYFAESGIQNVTMGTAVKGWLSLLPPDMIQDELGEEVVWYYFESNGKPKSASYEEIPSTNDFIRINSKSYLFNEYGNPVSGLVKVQIAKTGEYTAYYFDDDSKLPLKGKATIEEADGTESTFYFNEGSYAGRGYTGVKDNYLYYMGKRQEAEDGMKYTAYTFEDNGEIKTYVVSETGRIVKNKTVKDDNGVRYQTNSSGILTHVDDVAVSGTEAFEVPNAPVFEE